MNLEHIAVLVAILACAAAWVAIFRRRPPIDAEFVTWEKLNGYCDLRHQPVKSDQQLQAEFVTRREYKAEKEMTDNFREELRRDVKRIDKNVTALATKMGIEVLDL